MKTKPKMKIICKSTHIEAVRDMAYKQMLQICDYLGWTEEQYCAHQAEEYEVFLKRMFAGWPIEMLNEVRYSPVMAGLWKNEWRQRDGREFLPYAEIELTPSMWVDALGSLHQHNPSSFNQSQVFDEYLWIHSSKRLVNDDEFMKQYNRALTLIRNESKGGVR